MSEKSPEESVTICKSASEKTPVDSAAICKSASEKLPVDSVAIQKGTMQKTPVDSAAIRKYLYCWIPVVIVVLDRLTKYWAQKVLQPKKSIPVIGDAVTFTYLENKGAAWGMLSGKLNFFVVLTALLIAGILFLTARIPSRRRYLPMLISFLCLIGGAFGNLYDRIFQGSVTDFISFDIIHFPVFNVADIFVTCSFILLIILLIFVYREEELSFIPLFGEENKNKK